MYLVESIGHDRPYMPQVENLAQPFGSELRRTAIVTCGPCGRWPRGHRIATDEKLLKPRGGHLIESVPVVQSGKRAPLLP
jgi:hypothetical protein